MKILLLVLSGVLVLLLAAAFYLYRRLKRFAASREVRAFGESFDGGLAIPMRDADTRRSAEKNQ